MPSFWNTDDIKTSLKNEFVWFTRIIVYQHQYQYKSSIVGIVDLSSPSIEN